MSIERTWHGKLPFSENKFWEMQLSTTGIFQDWFLLNINLTRHRDHAGFYFAFGVYKAFFEFNVYDHRHWNEDIVDWDDNPVPHEDLEVSKINLKKEGNKMSKILIVNSNVDNLLNMADLLSHHDVVLHASARLAMRCFKKMDFDLVIAEVEHPGMHGFEFYDVVQDIDFHKFIFISDVGVYRERALVLGDAYIDRSSTDEEFVATVDRVLKSK
jgi:CheY-like chemotaxis protein